MKGQGISVDKESLSQFFKQLEGKTITDAVKAGEKKHISMPAGGGGGGAAAATSAGPAAAAADEKKEEPKKTAAPSFWEQIKMLAKNENAVMGQTTLKKQYENEKAEDPEKFAAKMREKYMRKTNPVPEETDDMSV